MSKTMDTIKTKLNFDNVDTTPPNDIVQGLAAQVNEATKGMVSCEVKSYTGFLDSYETLSLVGLLDFAKPKSHDVQDDLGAIGYEYKKFELLLTASILPHYMYRLLLFGFGIGGYPVKLVLEQGVAEAIQAPNYTVIAKNRNELVKIISNVLTSSKSIEVMQDLINATLIHKAVKIIPKMEESDTGQE